MKTSKLDFWYSDKFDESWSSLRLTDQQKKDFEFSIAAYYANPPSNNYGKQFPGNLIRGTGGAYKYRYPDPNSNRGKSGSYRVIYFVVKANLLLFLNIYDKHTKTTLTKSEKAKLRALSRKVHRKES